MHYIVYGTLCHSGAAHFVIRSPFASSKARTRAGDALPKPATSRDALMSAHTCFRRVTYVSLVSLAAEAGVLSVSLRRTQLTAVSWSISSCRLPGC